jgi:hypothetical protein
LIRPRDAEEDPVLKSYAFAVAIESCIVNLVRLVPSPAIVDAKLLAPYEFRMSEALPQAPRIPIISPVFTTILTCDFRGR